ncbi:autotransporter domain-containing protein [Bordetella sp. N]|uniref:autotransporter outer membrane beta-barrel domain-containing protein n=1 Tax=Bordetella sp. N TaxID=1746199 RepID=UPI00071087F7|nr:autotransporter outer membrane beta-barrel domain-containing protein [Bordetella sp. N]ALM84316.1 hypothetical protein ASB57_16280 [Bordetella sp. N]
MWDPGDGIEDDRFDPMHIRNHGRLNLRTPVRDDQPATALDYERKVGSLISEGVGNTIDNEGYSNNMQLGGPVKLSGTTMRYFLSDLPHRLVIKGDLTVRNAHFKIRLSRNAHEKIRDGQEILSIVVDGKVDDDNWFGAGEFWSIEDMGRREKNKEFKLEEQKIVREDGKTEYVVKFRRKKDLEGAAYVVSKDPPVLETAAQQPLPPIEGIEVVEDESTIEEAGAAEENGDREAARKEKREGTAEAEPASEAEAAEAGKAAEVVLIAEILAVAKEAPAEEPPPPPRLADFVTSPNQKSVATAVDTLPSSHPVNQAAYVLATMDPAGLSSFSSAISGEVHPTVGASLQAAVEPVRDVSMAQLRAGLFGGRQPGALTADAGVSDAPALAGVMPSSTIYPAWAQVTGNWQKLGGGDHSAKGSQRSGGVFIGMDEDIGNGWRMGGALGFTDSRLSVANLASSANISSYSAILYGGKVLPAGPGAVHLMLGAAYTWHDVRTRRRVTGGGLDQQLRGNYSADTAQLFTEAGYAVPVTPDLTVQPYAGLSQTKNQRRSFDERGGSAALSGKRQRSDTTTVSLGVRATQDIDLGRHKGQLSGALGWRRNSGDLRTKASMSFDTGDNFTVTGAPVARDTMLVETGVKVQVGKSTAMRVDYAGQFGGGTRNHSASLTVNWRF